MNSTAILFLKMLKTDIKRRTCEKLGVDFNTVREDMGLLTGQMITMSEIMSLPSYRLMNLYERQIFESVLDGMRHEVTGESVGRSLSKHIESLVPTSTEHDSPNIINMPRPNEAPNVEFKDAA